MEVTATVTAYVSPHSSLSPADLAKPGSVSNLTFWGKHMDDSAAKMGYTKVGTAQITVTLIEQNELIANKIEALKGEAAGIRAEATAKCTRIEKQIQNLLCIENGASTATVFAKPDDETDIPF